ncbi:hypothetical protein [Corynebacterium spheniscorum]|uniref:Uncharacterized protein n=1 Tax=Corynebacterium spheniscorum TaxID=185761 RepID=A0A1I2QW33_9CORY|nr:hypothetical protein [Corynebacterium spheniscorum]KAA8719446.1 hypothetical protein F4V56_10570 [Corynebacterium spheniscorum]SFG30507.1 hypothetical protein SAMN05660282_00569 [Corynebacterium spheniscorum]
MELRIDIDNCTLGELKSFVDMAVTYGARLDDYLHTDSSVGEVAVTISPEAPANEEENPEDDGEPADHFEPEDDLRRARKFGSFAAEDSPNFDIPRGAPRSGPYFYDPRQDRGQQHRGEERRGGHRSGERSRSQSDFDRLIDDFSDIARTVLDPRIGEAAVRSVLDAWDRRNGNGRYGNGRYGGGRYRR